MSPIPISEAEISEILKSVKPISVEINKTINSLLIVKRWGFHALNEAVKNSTIKDPAQLKETVRLAVSLSEFDFHLIERAVEKAGVDICERILSQVSDLVERAGKDIEVLADNRDALFTIDGLRRTPGGIFWRFLKENISKDDAKYVFKDNTKRQQGLRRKIVREKWTENHLTILKKHRTSDVRVVKDIAEELSMSEVSIIERLVVRKGTEYSRSILAEVNSVMTKELNDPYIKSIMLVSENNSSRRRTPGGVFAQIIKSKSDISESDKKFIFAKATGGRAPSMSDLMAMSLALQDKVVVVHADSSSKKINQEEWEFQRKVGKTWEPGFVGQDNFSDPIADLKNEKGELDDILGEIARGLKLYTIDFVEKVYQVVGRSTLVAAYKETIETERRGGLPISDDNPRKRTPKGVFVAILRKLVGSEKVDSILSIHKTALPPQVVFETSTNSVSKIADQIIVELERLRIPESDFDIIRTLISIKGESFVRNLFEKVRKRFNKGKWLDTPGQLFGKMLKIGLTNDELNRVFEYSRITQLARNNKLIAAPRRATIILTPSEERCVSEITIGLALIGVTTNEVSTMERLVSRLGEDRALRILNRTMEIEREGGQRTRDQQRRKTPSGVFMSLLSTEEKISKEDLKYIQQDRGSVSLEERKKEDSHFAPSLFTPINPLRFIDQSGMLSEIIDRLKKEVRPSLAQLEYVSVLDPRLETVIRGVVLMGTSAIHLIDQCVYVFGEKRTEGWLEISHAQVADSNITIGQLTEIYGDLVKAAGGLPPLETSAGIRS
jgi:hypothetical protein